MIKTYRPTSPGVRHKKSIKLKTTTSKPTKSLIVNIERSGGRSNGRISVRHKSKGVKKFYRIIDFKRDKYDIPGKISSFEYDPNRGPLISLVVYADGEKRYILAVENTQIGSIIVSGNNAEYIPGNNTQLRNIPVGANIHAIELNPKQGASIVRGAGNYGILMAKEGEFAQVKLPSGEIKKISLDCRATIGVISNSEKRNERLGKAGIMKHKGIRPSVRGVAMANPSDHPHAGSYRDNGIGMPSPKSPWGWKTRGVRTRKRVHTDKFIIKSRRGK